MMIYYTTPPHTTRRKKKKEEKKKRCNLLIQTTKKEEKGWFNLFDRRFNDCNHLKSFKFAVGLGHINKICPKNIVLLEISLQPISTQPSK